MAQMNETLTATEVIRNRPGIRSGSESERDENSGRHIPCRIVELQKNVESAYKHGLKPQNDVLKVQVKLNESELGIRKAENALRLATMNLCHLIGKPLTTEILISGDFPEIEQEMELQVLDITRRPEYGILDKQVAIARQQVKLNRSEPLPKVGIKGSYDYVHGLELNEKNFLDNASFSVLLNVSIPLFHFGERNNKVRAAKARLEQTRLQQQNLNEQMLLELTQAAKQFGRSENWKRNSPTVPCVQAEELSLRQQKPVRSRTKKLFQTIWKPKHYGNRHTKPKWMPVSNFT